MPPSSVLATTTDSQRLIIRKKIINKTEFRQVTIFAISQSITTIFKGFINLVIYFFFSLSFTQLFSQFTDARTGISSLLLSHGISACLLVCLFA